MSDLAYGAYDGRSRYFHAEVVSAAAVHFVTRARKRRVPVEAPACPAASYEARFNPAENGGCFEGRPSLAFENESETSSVQRRVAEGAGFEPAIRFPVYTLSRRAPSTTRPPVRRAAYGVHARDFQGLKPQAAQGCVQLSFAVA